MRVFIKYLLIACDCIDLQTFSELKLIEWAYPFAVLESEIAHTSATPALQDCVEYFTCRVQICKLLLRSKGIIMKIFVMSQRSSNDCIDLNTSQIPLFLL